MKKFAIAVLFLLAVPTVCLAGQWVVTWTVEEMVPVPCEGKAPYWDEYLQRMVTPLHVTLEACFETTTRRVSKVFGCREAAVRFVDEAPGSGWNTELKGFEISHEE